MVRSNTVTKLMKYMIYWYWIRWGKLSNEQTPSPPPMPTHQGLAVKNLKNHLRMYLKPNCLNEFRSIL
jgi:hypothetical protein